MGGKGDDNSSSAMYTPAAVETPKVISTPYEPAVKKEAKKDPPITEDPTKGAGDQTSASLDETQPYAPPGFGNYGDTNTNMSPLGDALVAGMQEQPGQPGPTNPKYFGQV
jgi:hypothetical protein